MSKITLHLKHGDVDVKKEDILCNDVILPGEYNPHNKRLWVIANEYGVLGALWADHEQDALDELIDRDMGKSLLVDEDSLKDMTAEEQEELAHLGNAGEPCDLTNVSVEPALFSPSHDCKLLYKFAEARGAGVERLSDL